MAPHLEHFEGVLRRDRGPLKSDGLWKPVPLTKHFSGDNTTNNARVSHTHAKMDPSNYREVDDAAGDVCPGYNHLDLLQQRTTEYSVEGKFPESKRILGIGPKKSTYTHLTTRNVDVDGKAQWVGTFELNNVTITRDSDNKIFSTEGELIKYLGKKYRFTYLRDLSKPAVSTG